MTMTRLVEPLLSITSVAGLELSVCVEDATNEVSPRIEYSNFTGRKGWKCREGGGVRSKSCQVVNNRKYARSLFARERNGADGNLTRPPRTTANRIRSRLTKKGEPSPLGIYTSTTYAVYEF